MYILQIETEIIADKQGYFQVNKDYLYKRVVVKNY